MQRLKSLNEIYQKRLIRGEFVHHQATPYPLALDPYLFNADGSIRIPTTGDTANGTTASGATIPFSRTGTAFTQGNSLVPGLCMVRTTGEQTTVATGLASAPGEKVFGLLANWVGGDFDDIGPQNVGSGVVGVWRGPDSTYTLLAPAFDPSITATQNGLSLVQTNGGPVNLYPGTDGRLKYFASPSASQLAQGPVARLLDVPAASRIVIDLAV